MDIVFFAAGAVYGALQYYAASRVFKGVFKPGWIAIYIIQLLILSLGVLVLVFIMRKESLPATAVGIVASSVGAALMNSLKR